LPDFGILRTFAVAASRNDHGLPREQSEPAEHRGARTGPRLDPKLDT
jgi:hypothetical protein